MSEDPGRRAPQAGFTDASCGPARELGPGAQLGPWRILRRIGAGGMGAVFEAESGAQRVAIKVLAEAEPEALLRFEREAQAAATGGGHPHIAAIHSFHRSPVAHLIMPLFERGALAAELAGAKGEPLHADRVLEIAEGIAAALEHLHARGVVHRDLKPANILLSEDGSPRVADFGLARLIDGVDLTRTGVTLGTPAYMAPEQRLGAAVDARADLWALGIILFEALTGDRPFRGANAVELAAEVSRAALDLDAVPPPWRPILRGLLAGQPDERWDAARLRVALGELREPPRVPSRAWAILALACLALAAALILAGTLVSRLRSDREQAALVARAKDAIDRARAFEAERPGVSADLVRELLLDAPLPPPQKGCREVVRDLRALSEEPQLGDSLERIRELRRATAARWAATEALSELELVAGDGELAFAIDELRCGRPQLARERLGAAAERGELAACAEALAFASTAPDRALEAARELPLTAAEPLRVAIRAGAWVQALRGQGPEAEAQRVELARLLKSPDATELELSQVLLRTLVESAQGADGEAHRALFRGLAALEAEVRLSLLDPEDFRSPAARGLGAALYEARCGELAEALSAAQRPSSEASVHELISACRRRAELGGALRFPDEVTPAVVGSWVVSIAVGARSGAVVDERAAELYEDATWLARMGRVPPDLTVAAFGARGVEVLGDISKLPEHPADLVFYDELAKGQLGSNSPVLAELAEAMERALYDDRVFGATRYELVRRQVRVSQRLGRDLPDHARRRLMEMIRGIGSARLARPYFFLHEVASQLSEAATTDELGELAEAFATTVEAGRGAGDGWTLPMDWDNAQTYSCRALCLKAEVARRRREWEAAAAFAREARRACPDASQAVVMLGDCLWSQGREDEAVQQARAWLAQGDATPDRQAEVRAWLAARGASPAALGR